MRGFANKAKTGLAVVSVALMSGSLYAQTIIDDYVAEVDLTGVATAITTFLTVAAGVVAAVIGYKIYKRIVSKI